MSQIQIEYRRNINLNAIPVFAKGIPRYWAAMRRVVFAAAGGGYEGPGHDAVVFGRFRQEGTWSTELVDLLARLFARGGTLLDVGANLGLCCIPALERSRATAWCFEPEPLNAALLRRNLARHRLTERVRRYEIALGQASGPRGLVTSPDNSGDHRVWPDRGRSPRSFAAAPDRYVMQRRLDDVLAGAKLERPVVMKLDTQGAELQVLRGARRTLSQLDALVIEYWPFGLRAQGDDVAGVQAELSEFSVGCVLAQDAPPRVLSPMAAVWRSLSFIGPRDEGFYDLLLLRRAGVVSRLAIAHGHGTRARR